MTMPPRGRAAGGIVVFGRVVARGGGCTHACVAGAARDAVPLGYAVIVVDDA